MKHIKRTVGTLIALSLFGISTANAELIIEDGTSTAVKPLAQPTKTTGFLNNSNQPLAVTTAPYKSFNVTEKGTRIITAPVEGWGDQIELSIVLKQIVPDGWKAVTKNGIDLSQKVSWKANNENWIDVFGKIADKNNFKANVDWNTRKIELIGNGVSVKTPVIVNTPVVSKQVVSAPVKPIFSNPSKTSYSTISSQPSSNVYSSQVQVWHMDKDKSLRENIEAWAKKEGWTVSWAAPNYPIIASFDLTGRLDDKDGPVITIIKKYENAQQPLVAKIFKGNKVIRIENRNYEQSSVVTTSVSEDYKTAN
jgi:hypothetical protein